MYSERRTRNFSAVCTTRKNSCPRHWLEYGTRAGM